MSWLRSAASSVANLGLIGDVTISSPSVGQALQWNGSAWVNVTLDSDDLSDVASIAMLDENEIITGSWRFTDYTYITGGNAFEVWDSNTDASIALQHDGTNAIVSQDENAASKGIMMTPGASTATRTGFYMEATGSVADDGTATITLPNGMDGGFVFLVSQTSSSTETGQHGAVFYFSNTTMIPLFTHTNWQFGSGSNPDVDTEHNVWRSAEATISIKNRRGSARYYSAYIFGGI